jgi:uncharacterized membrane protein
MYFAVSLPWWIAVAIAAAIAGVAVYSYRVPLAGLPRFGRAVLVGLRALTLGAVVAFLCRPFILQQPTASGTTIIPVLVDASRSMRVRDVDGRSRIEAAAALANDLLPSLSSHGTPEIYSVGHTVVRASVEDLAADRRSSDLAGALATVRERMRGRRVPGVILLSDGADTGREPATSAPGDGPPVFTVGFGSARATDREVLGLTAGDPQLDQASVDLRVTAISHGFGRAPYELRVLADGRIIDSRRVVPQVDGSPIEEVFTVSPDLRNPTVYSVEIVPQEDEAVVENNKRSLVVSPAGRKRRILILAGGPAYEHSFMTRALSRDSGLELDFVVRKGQNEEGRDTFMIQAGSGRASMLTAGFPATKAALHAYDGLLLANIEGDVFTRAQLGMVADFVAERGGGLLVMGGRSFAGRGLLGTPLEDVLPVELNDRRGGLTSDEIGSAVAGAHNTVALTREGVGHPVMRIGPPADIGTLWSGLPALAGSALVGGPRPGASVLAVVVAPGGRMYPLVAVQRYGRGRSMIFAGEGSWRWRMMVPSTDRRYELFWRQAARWLSVTAPDPVTVIVPAAVEPGDSFALQVDARTPAFEPASRATLDAVLTTPRGEVRALTFRSDASVDGRFTTALAVEQPGLHRLRVEAKQDGTFLGAADRWFLVGGADREFHEPRLNEGFLRRIAEQSGGRYVAASDAGRISAWLRDSVPQNREQQRRDLWHNPWAFAFVIALLASEWTLRRRWGLR